LIIYVDGGARGNPGPAGAGVVLRENSGKRIHEAGYYLGRQTNNAAEYHALIRALERAARIGPQPLTIYSDSELLVRQLTGEYQVKSPKLAPLYRQVQTMLVKAARWTVRHVPREENQQADELANLAMDEQRDVLVFDVDGEAEGWPAGAVKASAVSADSDPPLPAGSTAVRHGAAAHAAGPAIRVTVSRPPKAGCCPAGGFAETAFTVSSALPAGLCVFAAHALLPTLLAMLNTDPDEFAAVPTLSVRCTNPKCGAEFKLSPVRSPNGGVPSK
jgi:ribonuclease HI